MATPQPFPVVVTGLPAGHEGWVGLAIAITSVLVALVAMIVSLTSASFVRRYNRSQVMISFHQRFDELTKAKYEAIAAIGRPTLPEALENPYVQGFVMRYWDMHYAEFIFWKQGLLRGATYSDWLDTLHRNRSHPIMLNVTYAEAWAYVRASNRFNSVFVNFMDSVFANGSARALKLYAGQGNQYRL